ncbi:MAG: RNA methyltransferase [Spirochaetia bacterium]|nr:RNA methyltransferase [Spirochaetia bacterium]
MDLIKPPRLHAHLIKGIVDALMDIFQKGDYADKTVDRFLRTHPKWGARDRRFFAEGVYECVRWWRRLWFAADLDPEKYLDRNFIAPDIVEKIWFAWFIIHNPSMAIPHLKIKYDQDPVKLWNLAPNRQIRESIPDWLDARGDAELKEHWEKVLNNLNKPALVYLRVNKIKTTRENLITELSSENISAQPVPGQIDALYLSERKNVFISQPYKKGFFEVQDLGSQKIVPFLDIAPAMRIIDACAGGGGKSLHMASLMGNKGKVIALDTNDWRLKPLRQRAARAGADIIETRIITSGKIIKRLSESADRLLLDVPCSGSGVLRRNPDTRWKLSTDEITRLVGVQQDILQHYSGMTKKGGMMVYATCSVFPSENEKQIETFLNSREGKEWRLADQFRIFPSENPESNQTENSTVKHVQYFENSDGFYAARLQRS